MSKLKEFFIKYLLPIGTEAMVEFVKKQGYVVYKDTRKPRRTAYQIEADKYKDKEVE